MNCICQYILRIEERDIDLSSYSVFPEGQHHPCVVKQLPNYAVVCSWHKGKKPCVHRLDWAEMLNVRLTDNEARRAQFAREFYLSDRDKYKLCPPCHSSEYIPILTRWRLHAPNIYDDFATYPYYDNVDHYSRDYGFLKAHILNRKVILRPESNRCKGCHHSLDDCHRQVVDSVLYTKDKVFQNIRVEMWKCNNMECSNRWNYYDGCTDHIFNWNSKKLFCHTIFNQFTHHLWSFARPSDYAFEDAIKIAYEHTGSLRNWVSVQTFLDVWRSFIGRQMWRFPMICLLCDRGLEASPNADPNGEVDELVADGTVCGAKKDQSFRIVNPKEIFDNDYVLPNQNEHSDRYIDVPKHRRQLERWLFHKRCFIHQDHVSVRFLG